MAVYGIYRVTDVYVRVGGVFFAVRRYASAAFAIVMCLSASTGWYIVTNLIHGEKYVISRDVCENMPNFTENSRKEFQKFTEILRAPQTLF